ncbi:MAG: hypothetical protein QOF58_6459, partial [Pseudonocardiales bacterium]|nr:hypothetical protein [Pseudonocardiales bacterium]
RHVPRVALPGPLQRDCLLQLQVSSPPDISHASRAEVLLEPVPVRDSAPNHELGS